MSISKKTLSKYLKEGDVFIETGTRFGDTVQKAVELGASHSCSIEIDNRLYEIACERLKEFVGNTNNFPGKFTPHVSLINRNSVEGLNTLPDILLVNVDVDIVVFLDAHSDQYSPVLEELKTISGFIPMPKFILIDDMRVFRAGHWDVTEDEILEAIENIGGYEISYDDGVEERDILVAKRKS
jgi:hypothetical protein